MADDLDILTREEAKSALNIQHGDVEVNVELGQVVTAASRFLDAHFGAVVVRDVVDEHHDGAGDFIVLAQAPASSRTPNTITDLSISEYDAGVEQVLTLETVNASPATAVRLVGNRLYRRSAWRDAVFASSGVVVSYTTGRFAATVNVDALFKEACAAVVMHFWQHRGSQSGVATFGQEGAPFSGVPFMTERLVEKLKAMLPGEFLAADFVSVPIR
ncbi:MAG TPA: hypothetical protein VF728_08330 [Nocardioides sp.]